MEVDETFIGQEEGVPKRRGYAHKRKVLSLLQPGIWSIPEHRSGQPQG